MRGAVFMRNGSFVRGGAFPQHRRVHLSRSMLSTSKDIQNSIGHMPASVCLACSSSFCVQEQPCQWVSSVRAIHTPTNFALSCGLWQHRDWRRGVMLHRSSVPRWKRYGGWRSKPLGLLHAPNSIYLPVSTCAVHVLPDDRVLATRPARTSE